MLLRLVRFHQELSWQRPDTSSPPGFRAVSKIKNRAPFHNTASFGFQPSFIQKIAHSTVSIFPLACRPSRSLSLASYSSLFHECIGVSASDEWFFKVGQGESGQSKGQDRGEQGNGNSLKVRNLRSAVKKQAVRENKNRRVDVVDAVRGGAEKEENPPAHDSRQPPAER